MRNLLQPKVHLLVMTGLIAASIVIISPLSVPRFILALLCMCALLWLKR